MNVVLFNLYDIPDYLKICLKQIKHFNTNVTIHLITDKNIQADGVKCYNINNFGITWGLNHKVKFFKNNPVKHHKELFLSSALRFIYIYELCRHLKLEDIFTFDNDVLIYGDLNYVKNALPVGTKIAFTQSVKNEFICGLCYFKSYNDIAEIAGDFEAFLQYAQEDLKNIFKDNFTGNFISEMSLLFFVNKIRDLQSYILPSSPKDSINNLVFDSITYGQLLGGLSPNNGGDGTPFIDKNHIIANDLTSNSIHALFDESIKKPVVIDNSTGKIYNLFNLHIHSKNLNKFKSFE